VPRVVRDYELMYILRPDLDEERMQATMGQVQSIIEAQGGEVRKTTPWGKRRLAYEIQKLRDGHYVLLEVALDGARIKEVDRALRIHDMVMRHMITSLVASPASEAEAAEAGELTAVPPTEPVDGGGETEETVDLEDENVVEAEES
jgi:small subunit ribosomal protein S6